jgi:hypothetical protein
VIARYLADNKIVSGGGGRREREGEDASHFMLRKKIEWKWLKIFCSRPTGIAGVRLKIDAKTLHVLCHTRLTLTPLFWKRNRLLHGRPLLVTECRMTMKFVLPVWPPPRGGHHCLRSSTYAVLFKEKVAVCCYGMCGVQKEVIL